MKCYLRFGNRHGELDFVFSSVDASRMGCEDAKRFHEEAFKKWPDLDWEVVNESGGESFLRGTDPVGQDPRRGTKL